MGAFADSATSFANMRRNKEASTRADKAGERAERQVTVQENADSRLADIHTEGQAKRTATTNSWETINNDMEQMKQAIARQETEAIGQKNKLILQNVVQGGLDGDNEAVATAIKQINNDPKSLASFGAQQGDFRPVDPSGNNDLRALANHLVTMGADPKSLETAYVKEIAESGQFMFNKDKVAYIPTYAKATGALNAMPSSYVEKLEAGESAMFARLGGVDTPELAQTRQDLDDTTKQITGLKTERELTKTVAATKTPTPDTVEQAAVKVAQADYENSDKGIEATEDYLATLKEIENFKDPKPTKEPTKPELEAYEDLAKKGIDPQGTNESDSEYGKRVNDEVIRLKRNKNQGTKSAPKTAYNEEYKAVRDTTFKRFGVENWDSLSKADYEEMKKDGTLENVQLAYNNTRSELSDTQRKSLASSKQTVDSLDTLVANYDKGQTGMVDNLMSSIGQFTGISLDNDGAFKRSKVDAVLSNLVIESAKDLTSGKASKYVSQMIEKEIKGLNKSDAAAIAKFDSLIAKTITKLELQKAEMKGGYYINNEGDPIPRLKAIRDKLQANTGVGQNPKATKDLDESQTQVYDNLFGDR